MVQILGSCFAVKSGNMPYLLSEYNFLLTFNKYVYKYIINYPFNAIFIYILKYLTTNTIYFQNITFIINFRRE